MDVPEYFTIQQVSVKLDIPSHTLRFWEKALEGFIVPSRTKGGQRRYDQETVSTIEKIKEMRNQEISLAEIKRRLQRQYGNGSDPARVRPKEIEVFADKVAEMVRSEVFRLFEKEGAIPEAWLREKRYER